MRVAINGCVGGFCLSKEAYEKLGLEWDGYGYAYNNKRTDPKLIEVIDQIGHRASGNYADVYVVDVPDDVKWNISCNAGIEAVVETHRVWN